MVDRAYKADLPRFRKTLEELRREFSSLQQPGTDWVALRIDPLLSHVATLEQCMASPRFSREFSRLRKGVGMFHSDLVYFRKNVSALKDLLASAKKSDAR